LVFINICSFGNQPATFSEILPRKIKVKDIEEMNGNSEEEESESEEGEEEEEEEEEDGEEEGDEGGAEGESEPEGAAVST